MKRFMFVTMLCAAMCLSAIAAMAAEVQVKGEFKTAFMYNRANDFYESGWDGQSEDHFTVHQRVRLQLDFIASENLKGVVQFEIGDSQWGQPGLGRQQGFGFDGDGVNVETKHAYIAFNVPNTDLVFQVGLQNVALPSAAIGNPVLFNDMAAVVASYAINDMISVVGVWGRLIDLDTNNTLINNSPGNDEFDAWALILPIKLGKFSITPWATLARLGKDAVMGSYLANANPTNPIANMLSPVAATALQGKPTTYDFGNTTPGAVPAALAPTANGVTAGTYVRDSSNPATNGAGTGSVIGASAPYVYNAVLRDQEALWAWWAGSAFKADFDPISVMVDFIYGAALANNVIADRKGFYAGGAIDYKLSFMTIGAFGWYASGEDGDWRNGSEQLPMVDGTAQAFRPTSFVFGGQAMNGVGELNLIEDGPAGKWGIGLAAKDMSFIKDLSHTVRVMYARGTNDPRSRYSTSLLQGIGMAVPGTPEVVGLTRPGDALASPVQVGVPGGVNVHGGGAFTPALSGVRYFRAYGPGMDNISMTTNDCLWEVNFDHKYNIYENLTATFEVGMAHLSIGEGDELFVHADTATAWKAVLGLAYKF